MIFEEVAKASVILNNKQGFYLECKVYKLDNELFAKVNNKFIRLYEKRTSNSNYFIMKIDIPNYSIGQFQKLILLNS